MHTIFFVSLTVQHYAGPLVEENHYYPFGLKVVGISSRAALRPATTYGYQGVYNEEDASTGYNEFTLRSYDSQIGRWIQSDPYDVEPGMYNGMGNDPVNQTDPSGGAPPDWGSFMRADGVTVPIWDKSIIDQGSAETYAKQNGLTNAKYIGKTGLWTSTVGGTVRRWLLFEDGGNKEIGADMVNVASAAINAANDPSVENKMRLYVNATKNVQAGFEYGAAKNIWGMAKGLFELAWYVNSSPSLEKMQYSHNLIMGIKGIADDATLNYNGNFGLALAGNYFGNKWNAITKGDLFDASSAAGAFVSDVAIVFAPELMPAKAGLGMETMNAAKTGPTVAEQAATISKQVGKNSISIRTPNKTLHFDLQGATHKGIPTPHIQQSLPNVNPKTGQVFWNKDRQWVQPMTQQDIRIIRNYLKSQ